jgi:hypothetical protein
VVTGAALAPMLSSGAALVAADEADWKSSLAARAAISPHSPVAVLDVLLAAFAKAAP